MKNFKRIINLMMAIVLALSLAACGGGNTNQPAQNQPAANPGKPEYSFTLAMDSPENTVTYLFAEKFATLVKEKSAGKMEVQIFANGQLGSDREIAESVQQGNIDFVTQNTAPQVNFVPQLGVFDMAKVFPDAATARKVLDGPFFDTIAAQYEKAGFKLLGYVDQGFRQMTTNKKVESFADFKGQKIRTMENPNHVAFWSALGANPTPMAWGEVYIGLQQKTIDAQENPYEVIVANKIYEQQKYVINTNHILHLISLITNPAKFNSLSPEYQKIITDSVAEAKVWANQQADERIDGRVKIMQENGVEIVELPAEVHAQMQEKAEAAYELIRGKVGAELVDGLLKAVEAAK